MITEIRSQKLEIRNTIVVSPTLLYIFLALKVVIPAKAGIQTISLQKQGTIEEIDSCLHGKSWIPDQVRNDNLRDL
jgi:hypothetical protein